MTKTPGSWEAVADWEGLKSEILERYCINAETIDTISEWIGCHRTTVANHLKTWGCTWQDRGAPRRYYEVMGLELPPEYEPRLKPVRHEYGTSTRPAPRLPSSKFTSYDEVTLHWSDVHFPFEDPRAVQILYQVTADMKPTTLVAQGDMLDLWQISNHRPPLEKKLGMHQIDIQDSVEQLADHLDIMVGLAQEGAQRIYLHGNHEDRFDRLLADMQTNHKTLALMRIPKIQTVLNLDYILGLTENGWETHSYLEGDRFLLHDRLLCIHGYKTTKYATNSHLMQYGKSVCFGHSHRIQNFTSRDLRGTDGGWNMGCLCDLDPHWRSRPDWHQGFGVVTWKKDKDNWYFNFEQVRIHDGVAIFRDKFYRG